MKGFTPGLFDRLLGVPLRAGNPGANPGGGQAGSHAPPRLSAEDLKDSVARDLEALLNTRSILADDALKDFPECSRSMVSYGLSDFADRSLSSPSDRAHICSCIEKTIACHEPRLRNVKALLEVREESVNRLDFSITALLVASVSQEPVNFDAVLQPSTLQYSIKRAARAKAQRAAT
ncbi:type VI secretion system baseplate subunit TssE [Massilia sp. DD77]|uniref:type VI secretion system baseplate subunit TssE n=1 Tax=Massilia sp. DD77 TaxID=3109349 RepID=UPI002FFD88B7